METRFEAMEQQVFKCQGMMERGINATRTMLVEFTNNYKLDAKNTEEAIFKLYEKIEHLQAQIYDLQNQNCEHEYTFKRMSVAADLRIPETRSSSMMVSLCLGRSTTSLHHQQLHHHHLRERRHKHMGMGTPLGNCQAWGRCPGIVSPSHSYLYCFI